MLCIIFCGYFLVIFLCGFPIVQETELDILSTVQNLLRQCSEPSVFLKPLTKLFSIVRSKPCRKVLCEVFKVRY